MSGNRATVFFVFFAVTICSRASAVYVIQPGPEGKDTCYGTVFAQDGTPDREVLYSGGWGDYYYNFFEFDLTVSPAASQTVKAECHIYAYVAPYDPGLQIERVTESWTEAGVTYWNNPSSVFHKNFGPLAAGWNAVDITQLYVGWKNGSFPNFGIKLTPTQNNNTNGGIASSDNLDVMIRPKLVVTTTDGPFFRGLGDLPGGGYHSETWGISGDGTTAVGGSVPASGFEAFRWTTDSGIFGLGDFRGSFFESLASGVSGDASTVVGYGYSTNGQEAFRWTNPNGMIGLGDLSGGQFGSCALATSADGSVVVGWSIPESNQLEAFRWTVTSGMVGLGYLPGGASISEATDVSSSGLVVVGYSDSASGSQAFRWAEGLGMIGLGDLSGGNYSSWAFGVSGDGAVIVGGSRSGSGDEAFRWTSNGGMVGLGHLPGGAAISWATATNADGSVVVGTSGSGSGYMPFIWDNLNGMRNLRDVLTNDFGLNLSGWTLHDATGVSDDGLTIVGNGTSPAGDPEAWIARFPSIPAYRWPVDSVVVGQVYGCRNCIDGSANYDAGVNRHTGIDLSGTRKTTIKAASSGNVVAVHGLAAQGGGPESIFLWNDADVDGQYDQGEESQPVSTGRQGNNHGLGITIIIRHADGRYSLYGHLDAVSEAIYQSVVVLGQPLAIAPSVPIGLMGFSEYGVRHDFGFHVHFEVKDVPGLGSEGDSGPYWGYTPGHPDLFGYHDPRAFVESIDVSTSAPLPVRNVAGGNLNVRSSPGLSYINAQSNIIATLGDGQKFVARRKVFRDGYNWYFIDLPSRNVSLFGPDGGWISGQFAIEEPSATQLVLQADGVNLRDAATTSGNELGKGFQPQRFVDIGPTQSGTGCVGPWHQTYLPGYAAGPPVGPTTGWLCSDYFVVVPGGSKGDLNCDNKRNGADIRGFVMAATLGQAAYESAYPGCNYLNGDFDLNAVINESDLAPFVTTLLSN